MDKKEGPGLKGHFGKHDGGYESQERADVRPHVGDDEAMRETLYGDHMSGRYGTPAYGATGGEAGPLADPSQQPTAARESAARSNADAGQNAQISAGSTGHHAMGAVRQDERDMPGISTDKRSDDTKP